MHNLLTDPLIRVEMFDCERTIPITGVAARSLLDKRTHLFEVAEEQIREIKKIDAALRNSIALMAAGGDWDGIKEEHYKRARSPRRPDLLQLPLHYCPIKFSGKGLKCWLTLLSTVFPVVET